MKQLPYLKQLIVMSGCVFALYAQPPEENIMGRPEPDEQMHSDSPPPHHENGIAFKPDGILPDPMMLRDPVRLKTLLNKIGVNDRSKQQILSLVRDFNKEMEERILRIHQEEINIRVELLKENPDLGTIQKIIYKKTQIFAEIEFSQIKRDVGIKKLLSDEEFEMWKSLLREQMRYMQRSKNGDQKSDVPGTGQKNR
jgi:hypothetical protein